MQHWFQCQIQIYHIFLIFYWCVNLCCCCLNDAIMCFHCQICVFDAQMCFEMNWHHSWTAFLVNDDMILKKMNENDIKLIHSNIYFNLITCYYFLFIKLINWFFVFSVFFFFFLVSSFFVHACTWWWVWKKAAIFSALHFFCSFNNFSHLH